MAKRTKSNSDYTDHPSVYQTVLISFTSLLLEWRLDKSAIFGGLTFAITAAMGSFFEPVARLV
jgi:hypothetical protein